MPQHRGIPFVSRGKNIKTVAGVLHGKFEIKPRVIRDKVTEESRGLLVSAFQRPVFAQAIQSQ